MKKISRADIVVGIPTYNESDSIGLVIEQVDLGLQKYQKDFSCVIINADNNSPDNTKKAFLKTPTKTPKIHIASGTKIRGKGINVLNIFKKAISLNARAVLLFDGDLESITPTWVHKYTDSIMTGYDFVTPFYSRNEYDGSITNHICYPLLGTFFSTNVRQPIGGDFALSGDFVKELLTKKWDKNILKYGMDIFLTVSALSSNKKIVQAYLGSKEHKPSLPKLGFMYTQVTGTLFNLLLKNRKSWKSEHLEAPTVLYGKDEAEPQSLAIDYKYLKTRALHEFSLHYKFLEEIFPASLYRKLEKMYLREKRINIFTSMWCEIMALLFKEYQKIGRKQAVLEAGRPLYFGRQVSFIKSTIELDYEKSEEKIIKQAKYFHAHRNKFLK